MIWSTDWAVLNGHVIHMNSSKEVVESGGKENIKSWEDKCLDVSRIVATEILNAELKNDSN